ncbi:hypothetical protein HA402_015570 [Bradysia odoriphaga]|nr:hypothetical protein HA402_015570 [Bradysia odoriphaga]
MLGNKVICLFLVIFIGTVLGEDEPVQSNEAVELKSFRETCRGNGEFKENKQITSVHIMGAERDRNLYIAVNNDPEIVAKKNYDAGNISDKFLVDAVIKSYFLKNVVDLCITGNSKELYGIHLK